MYSFELAWQTIEARLAEIAVKAKEKNPQLWYTLSTYSTEIYPLRGYAAFSRTGRAGDEDLVVMIAARKSEGFYDWSFDVSGEINPATDRAVDRRFFEGSGPLAWLSEAVAQTMSALDASEADILDELTAWRL